MATAKGPHEDTDTRGLDSGSLPSSGGITVVLPCLNEEHSVGLCVRQALEALDRRNLQGEVLVVDNGSTDRSVAVAEEAGARTIHEDRPGYGSALKAGILAGREVIVMADADFTYALDRIPELVDPILEESADLVIGTRVAEKRAMPFLHRFLGTPVLTFLVRRAAGDSSVTDSQSGFRAFRRDALLSLGLRSSGMEFASEMLIRGVRAGWRIREVRTPYRPRIGDSKLNTLADGRRHLRLITLLAPDLALIWPGAISFLLGLVLAVLTLVSPSGAILGSIRWQPVFFSTIAMVFGAQALLAGFVVAYRSSVGATRRRYAFVGRPGFLKWCLRGGLIAILAGLAINVWLFILWVSERPAPSHGLQLASLAQGLIIVGISVAAFGFVTRLILDSRGEELKIRELGLRDFAPSEDENRPA